jgi:hypothetical protein
MSALLVIYAAMSSRRAPPELTPKGNFGFLPLRNFP